MTPEIQSEISRLIEDADNAEARQVRAKLFDRFMGEPYGDEVEGQSAFIDTSVSDGVEAVAADVLDVFTDSEKLAVFDEVGPEDEEAALQETEIVHHIFWEKNPGFINVNTSLVECLVQQVSYWKFGWQDKERVTIEEYADLDPDELSTVLNGLEGEYKILERDGGDPILDEFGAVVGVEPVSIKVRCVKTTPEYVVEVIPQEEFFITPRWNKVSPQGAPCCGHKRMLTVGDLVAMGFDRDSIEEACSSDSDDDQKSARHDTEDAFEGEADEGAGLLKEVEVFEAYMFLEVDGAVGLYQVWAGGDGSTVLKWESGDEAIEEVSHSPFACQTPYLIPHRHVGRSQAEQTDDIQEVKTVLTRHMLDNLYKTNYARPHYDDLTASDHTLSDLQNPAHGAPVRTGGAVIDYPVPPSVAPIVLPLLDKFDDLQEKRTGSTRYNQGLDANSLNKTATGITRIMDAGQKRSKKIARTIAETGLRDVFLGIHRDLRSGPVKELAVKLRGKWVQVNPRTWRDRTDMTVRVGIGAGDQQTRREGLMLLGNVQRELIAGGSPMVGPQQIYNSAKSVLQTYGFKDIAPYLIDPSTIPPPPQEQPQPDPALMLAGAQIENMQAETRRKAAEADAKMQLEREFKERELALRERELAVREQEAAARVFQDGEKLDLDRNKAVMADDLARDQMGGGNTPPVDYGEVTGN